MKTVAQLIEELQAYPQDLPVVIFTVWSADPPQDPQPKLTTTADHDSEVVYLDYES